MVLTTMFKKKIVTKIVASIFLTGLLFSCQSGDNAKKASVPKAKTPLTQKVAVTSPDTSAQKILQKQEQRTLVVYYLHGTFRCPSCNKIERLTKEAVEQGFAEEIKRGRVELKVINVEESGNEHFVDDYKLYTKSVILSDQKDGKEASWKNLEQVWTLLGSEAKFVEYIQKEVKTYLEG